MANIFTKNPAGSYYLTQCQLTDLTSCRNTIDGVVAYAQNDFSQQIRKATTPGVPLQGNLSVVGEPVIGNYAIDLGLKPVTPLSQEVMTARYNLATLYNTIQHSQSVVDHLRTSPTAQQYMDLNKLNAVSHTLAWNLSIFDTGQAVSCYMAGEENNCPATLATVQSNMQTYDNQYDDMYVFTCSEQTVAPTCSEYSTNICNIYTGTRFVNYPYDSTSYFGAISGQFTPSPNGKTLTYAGQWTPPSSRGNSQTLSGAFSLNPDGFWQAPQSQLTGFGAFCGSGDVYIRKIENPF